MSEGRAYEDGLAWGRAEGHEGGWRALERRLQSELEVRALRAALPGAIERDVMTLDEVSALVTMAARS
jgi:hypothetical protein